MSVEALPAVSERARTLLRGAFDTHVHIAPDVVRPADRRPDARTPLRRAGARRVPAEVALHLDGGARVGRARGRSRRRGARGDRAQPRRRRDEPRRGRDRRARGRAHGLAPDGRLRQRERRGDAVPAGGEDPGLDGAPARAARGGPRARAGGGRRRRRRRAARDAGRAPHGRAARPRARHRPPLARRDLRRRRRGARGGRARDRDHASRLPVAEPFDRGPGRAGLARRLARALLHDAAHRQDRLGGRLRGDSRHRGRALGALDRSRPDGEPAGRGRPRADGRPAARGRLRRGGGAHDGGREHAGGSRGWTREPAPARDRRALGRLRLAGGRRRRRHDPRRRRGARDRPLLRRARRVRASSGRSPARRSSG